MDGRRRRPTALEKWETPEKGNVSSFVGQFWEKSLEDLYGELQGTKAAPYLDPKGEKTAHSILATVNNGIEGFSLLESLLCARLGFRRGKRRQLAISFRKRGSKSRFAGAVVHLVFHCD